MQDRKVEVDEKHKLTKECNTPFIDLAVITLLASSNQGRKVILRSKMHVNNMHKRFINFSNETQPFPLHSCKRHLLRKCP